MSIIRITVLLRNVSTYDASWDFVHIANWNSIEVNSAIVVSCLIVLKPLIRKLSTKLFPASDQDLIQDEPYPGYSGETMRRRARMSGLTPRRLTVVEMGGAEELGNEKRLAGGDASPVDVESQTSGSGSGSGRICHMAH